MAVAFSRSDQGCFFLSIVSSLPAIAFSITPQTLVLAGRQPHCTNMQHHSRPTLSRCRATHRPAQLRPAPARSPIHRPLRPLRAQKGEVSMLLDAHTRAAAQPDTTLSPACLLTPQTPKRAPPLRQSHQCQPPRQPPAAAPPAEAQQRSMTRSLNKCSMRALPATQRF
jgi:hypothetical protein